MVEFSIGLILGIFIMCCLYVSRENKAEDKIKRAIDWIENNGIEYRPDSRKQIVIDILRGGKDD